MDEMMWLRVYGGGFGSSVDLTAILAFLTFGVISFLAPVVGYRPVRSAGVTVALFLMIAYVGVSVVQLLVQWLPLLDGSGGRALGRRGMGIQIVLTFALAKMLLFLVAMLAFAIGLVNFELPAAERKA